jgi:hypothetical protein
LKKIANAQSVRNGKQLFVLVAQRNQMIEAINMVQKCFVFEEGDKSKLEKKVQQAIETVEKLGLEPKIKLQAELDQNTCTINWYYSVMVFGVERKTSL